MEPFNFELSTYNFRSSKALLRTILCLALGAGSARAVPIITSFNPASGAPGATITLSGLNFSPAPSNNIVYFGATRASVLAASSNSLSVAVPPGATYAPITVTVAGLTAYAKSPFQVTFPGPGVFDASSLGPRVDVGVGQGPARISIGDLDGDGKPDLVIAQSHDSTIWVFRNIGASGGPLSAGSFAPPVVLPVGGAADSLAGLALADLDGDGRLDLLAVDYLDNKVSVFQNLSAPGTLNSNSFGARLDLAVGASARDVAVADLDGDGRPDIAVACYDSSSVSIIQNINSGALLTTDSFAPRFDLPLPSGSSGIAIVDLDGDGKMDIVTANASSGSDTTSVFRNTSLPGSLTTNSFAPRVDFAGGGEWLAVGDLDGDGKPDVAVGSWSKQVLSVFRNTSAAGGITTNSLAPRVDFPAGANVHRVAIGDLDGDGKPEVVVVAELSSLLAVFKNNSTPGTITSGSLAAPVDFSTGWNAHALAIGDLNGDGLPDVALVSLYDATLTLYQNSLTNSGPPIIVSQPTNQTVGVGGTANFSVVAGGAAPLSYQWFFDGTNLDGASSASLTLSNVQAAQAGNYSVLVSNIAGSILSSNAVLSVSPCAPAPAGLVAWWQAEGNANDYFGVHNGRLGLTGFATGEVGQAFSFNGVNQSVQILDPASSLASSTLSVEAWVNPASQVTNADGQSLIFGQGQGVQLLVRPGTTGLRIVFGVNLYSVGSTNEIPIGQFSHLAGTWDGTNLALYINGILSAHSAPGTVGGSQPCYYYIGGFSGPAADTCVNSSSLFNGLIDEVSYYFGALTPNQIAAIYDAGIAGKCTPAPIPPPVIVLQPSNRTVRVGDAVTFISQASGTPPLSRQWLFNGTNLPGATSETLTLYNVHSNNVGQYSFLVTNFGGSALSSNATLSLLPPPPCFSPPAGLVSWWRAENNATDSWGTNNGTWGTNYGTQGYPRFGPGKVGQAFTNSTFIDPDYVLVPDSQSLHLTDGLTIEAWVYPWITTVSSPGGTIVSKVNYDAGYPPGVSQGSFYLGTTNNGALFFTVSSSGSVRSNTNAVQGRPLPANQWSLVVATYDGAALRLYLNGQLGGQINYSAGIFAGTNALSIGAIPSGTSYIGSFLPWTGLLDEVSIYNRALSANEIERIYNAGSAGKCLVPPVIATQPQSQAISLGEDVVFSVSALGIKPFKYQWRFNNQNLTGATNATLLIEKLRTNNAGTYSVVVSNSIGSTLSSNALLTLLPPPNCVATPPGLISWWPADGFAADAMGTNNLTAIDLVAPTGYATGKVGLAFSLSGLNSRLSAPSNPSINFGSNADFSIEGWIKALPPRAGVVTNANVPIIEKRTIFNLPFSSGAGYSLSLNQGRLAFWLGTAGTFPTNTSMFISPGPDLRDSVFHHVALSLKRNATNGGNLYVDGQLAMTFDPTSRRGDLGNSSPLYIGAPFTTISNSFFNGLVDEFAIYNRALSAAEVLAIRQAGAAGKCKVPPSIVTQPTNQRVTIGSNVTFSVTAAGSPRLRYQWLFIGTPIVGATNSTYSFLSSEAHTGNYSVLVTNVFGRVTSTNALFTVNHLPQAACTSVTVSADSNCTANASINNGSHDPDGEPILIVQSPPGPYPLGTNLVTLTVTDPLGAFSSCAAIVTVVDTTPPLVLCPMNIVATNDFNQCGAVVTFPAPTANDACSGVASVLSTPPPGSFFPVGSVPVVWTATDGAGNVASCTFTVTVHDVQAPVIVCPADIVVTNAHDAFTSVVTFSPTVTDNCSGVGLPACDPPSGSAFGIGTNVVNCTAMDAAGNVSHCSFNITVLPGNKPPVPVLEVSPIATFPGWTNLFVISPNNTNASVVFEGSKSYDPDDPTFLFYWYEGTNVFSTNAVATNALALGTHKITLWLDDTFPLGTNAAAVTVDIIPSSEAVGIVIGLVGGSTLSAKSQQPLMASLAAATASFDRGNFISGANQLGAFENKVRAQVAPSDPALANQLIAAVEQIINAVPRAP